MDGDVEIAVLTPVSPGVSLARPTRMRAPSASPAGTLIVSDSVRKSGLSSRTPDSDVGLPADPPHGAHGLENTMWPRADLMTPVP